MSKLVSNPGQVEANAVRFEKEVAKSTKLQGRLPYARAWYAFPNPNTGWRYIPSKFGGYQGMTADGYLDDTPRDGRRTEKQLSQWFIEVPEDSDLYTELYDGLVAFLHKYGKTPSTKTRISVSPEVYESQFDDDGGSEDSALVDLILLVAKKLPRYELKRLRDAL